MEPVPVHIECFVIVGADKFEFTLAILGSEINSENRLTRSRERKYYILIQQVSNLPCIFRRHFSAYFE